MNSIRISIPVQLVPLATAVIGVGLGLTILFAPNARSLILLFLALGAGTALTFFPHAVLFPFYLCYLMVEGAAKVWTNYHPVVHVGSDVILLFVFVRLFNRFLTDTPATPQHQTQISVVTGFLAVYWLWVAVQFLNPWGLGIIPSLASLKVHVVPMLSFFIVAYLLRQEEVDLLPKVVLLLGLAQCVFALTDYTMGRSFLAGLNGNYGAITNQFLPGQPYRPFGTTNLPGAPSLWVFHSLFAALLVLYLVRKKKVKDPHFWKGMLFFYAPLALATLVACQVRSAVVRFMVVACLGLLLAGKRTAKIMLIAVAGVVLYYSVIGSNAGPQDTGSYNNINDRFGQAFSRIQTLESTRSWEGARHDLLALKRLRLRAQSTLMGIGLSRTAASSGPWAGRIQKDPYFGPDWSFTDNVFLALFTELGIGGLLSYIAMVIAIVWCLFRIRTYPAAVAAVYCGGIFLSGVASEGILYQPDASAFWAAIGVGFRFDGGGVT